MGSFFKVILHRRILCFAAFLFPINSHSIILLTSVMKTFSFPFVIIVNGTHRLPQIIIPSWPSLSVITYQDSPTFFAFSIYDPSFSVYKFHNPTLSHLYHYKLFGLILYLTKLTLFIFTLLSKLLKFKSFRIIFIYHWINISNDKIRLISMLHKVAY